MPSRLPPRHDRAPVRTPPPSRPRGRATARRLRDPITPGRRIRSAIGLLVTAFLLGVLLAAVLAAAIGAIVVALQHALNG